ncbi:hypothetical protein CJF42_10350 [Pseudoalteromonas sp. NBT06-2]|nr:hypothetical protein CJF42_10350 [Pseudoalteromonas sp. NBT06-2]
MMLTKTNNIDSSNTLNNWPVVGTLLFLTGIAGIPAMFGVALVALGVLGFTGESSLINNIHFAKPGAMFVHGGAGVLFFLTMPFQFSPKVRENNPKRHKLAGRIAVISGCIMAISGVWMHNVLSPESQGVRYSILIVTSMAICSSFLIALYYVIKGNIQVHQLWMARSIAIVLAAITPLFIDILILIIFSNFEVIYTMLTQFQYDYGRLLGIVINLSIVEIIMRKSN